jgi:hypothetical protein
MKKTIARKCGGKSPPATDSPRPNGQKEDDMVAFPTVEPDRAEAITATTMGDGRISRGDRKTRLFKIVGKLPVPIATRADAEAGHVFTLVQAAKNLKCPREALEALYDTFMSAMELGPNPRFWPARRQKTAYDRAIRLGRFVLIRMSRREIPALMDRLAGRTMSKRGIADVCAIIACWSEEWKNTPDKPAVK